MISHNSCKILSVGQHLPRTIVKSEELFADFQSETRYGIPLNWMNDNMGVYQRRMAPSDARPSDIALPAAIEALDNSGIHPDQIELVIFCGIERDYPEPATAHVIADRLELHPAHAFDIANACHGFIHGLQLAAQFIETGEIRHAMVVTGEITSQHVISGPLHLLQHGVDLQCAWKLVGMLSCGDAGGAVVLGPSSSGGFEKFTVVSDSKHQQKCYYKSSPDGFDGQMMMGQLSALMINAQRKIWAEVKKESVTIDWLLSHQIGKRPFEKIVGITGVDHNKAIKTLHYLGNITTATFPIGFYKLRQSGRLKPGHTVAGAFAGSGIVNSCFLYQHQ